MILPFLRGMGPRIVRPPIVPGSNNYGAGTYSIVIPEYDVLTATIWGAGGGGGGNAQFSNGANVWYGGTGGTSYFSGANGTIYAYGGTGGGNGAGGVTNGVNGSPGSASGGNLINSPGGGNPGGAGRAYTSGGGLGGTGGTGGLVQTRWTYGAAGAPRPGDTYTLVVGGGGAGGYGDLIGYGNGGSNASANLQWSYAVGIEIDNPGKLQKVSDGVYKNEICTIDTNKDPSLKVEYAKTTAHGAGYWLHYSPEQIAAVTELCSALAQTFKIEDIITHWMISPGRKIDTNPLYPLDELKAEALPYHPAGLLAMPEDGERHDADEAGEEHVDLGEHSDVRDESATAPGKLKAFIKSKFTTVSGLFGGLSVTSFLGVLQDWKVIVALGTFIVIGLALWIWMEKE